MRSQVGIIGLGTVGKSMQNLFPDATIYDPWKGFDNARAINNVDIAFVCVPTDENPDGSADISLVEGAIESFSPQMFVIRSTVPPGTTDRLATKYSKWVVFQPEYLGMTPGHQFGSDREVPFVILGGSIPKSRHVADLYRSILPPNTAYHFTTAMTAELVKYATNTFLATKVEFANELYDACIRAGVEYDELRELWLLDPRIGRSHTGINPGQRGFGGACFPKDISAFISWAHESNLNVPVIQAARSMNLERRGS